jgi:hypothetical protein
VSLIAHALVGGAPAMLGDAPADAPVELARKLPPIAGVFEQAARQVRVAEGRRRLVDEARAKLARGELELGEFLLAANDLDAQEQRRTIDIVKARDRYQTHLRDLRAAMTHEDVRRAVPAVFGHFRYHGRPGGRVADALLEEGGSCEPISQLVAASLYDAGLHDSVFLRFYGGAIDGATHLAPIYVEAGPAKPVPGAGGRGRPRSLEKEFDLMSGGLAERGGVRFPASDLVEAYARAHGLAPGIVSSKAGPGAAMGEPSAAPQAAAPSTMAGGYPPNPDRYPGRLPLFSARAVNEARADGAAKAAEPVDHVPNCAFMIRMAVLDPPRLRIDPSSPGARSPGEGIEVEPHRLPHPQSVERDATLIKAVEQHLEDPRTDHADRLMELSCLVALYDGAAVDLALLSQLDLAATAEQKRREAAIAGAKALAAVQWSGDEGAKVRRRLSSDYAGRSWLLLLLPGGEEVVFDLVRGAQKEDWGVINALAALVVAPRTRSRAVAILDKMPRRDQADVMHEVLHAHDHLRPWASHYALDGGDEGEFYRAYRVFRAIGWALWEGGRSAEETLASLKQGVAAEHLPREWEVIFVEYYARNALGLHQSRPGGIAVARSLKGWLAAGAYPELDTFRRRLDYVDSQDKLDSTTLSDAWRIQ